MDVVTIVFGLLALAGFGAAAYLAVGLAKANARLEVLREREAGLASQLEAARGDAEALGRAERELRDSLASARERLASAEELRRQLEADRAQLKESFKGLAGDVLRTSSEDFLKLAAERFKSQQQAGESELEKRKAAVEQLVKPIGETLRKTEERLIALTQQVMDSREAGAALREETAKLVRALSRPEVRGQYGEIQLRRVAELAGMTAYCDFAEQVSERDDDGRLQRPDMVVRLPNERVLAVDAKTNTFAYIEAVNASSEAEREAHLDRFTRHVSEQARKLADKRYWSLWDGSPEFVVMFVPGDHFIDAALSRRPELLDEAAQRGVILASPATLIGLLKAVAVGWREHRVAEEARALLEMGRELHERTARINDLLASLGKDLERTTGRYNDLIGSYESRFMPTLRKFEDMGVRSGKELSELEKITVRARLLEGATERKGD